MSSAGAFGAEARKQSLLEDTRAQGPAYQQWLNPEKDPAEVAQDYGLHLAFLRLLPVLGGYGTDDKGKAFLVSALEALPVGGDELSAVRRWFLAAWDHPTYGIGATLASTPLLAPAEAIIDLVLASIAGPVEKQAWRRARSALLAAIDAAGLSSDLADPVLSMAWDLEQTPGAAGDVANAWGGPILWRAHAEDADQFTPAESDELMETYRLFHEQAMETVGELTPGNAEQYAAYQAAQANLWAAQPRLKALKQRSDDRGARANATFAAWRREARQALLDCVRTAPVASPV